MTDLDKLRNGRRGRGLIIPGAIALILGLVGVVTYVVLAANETPGAATGQGAIQGLLIVVSAALVGVGVLLLAMGAIKHRRRSNDVETDSSGARTLDQA
jgi:hypothetical protein